MKTVLLWLIRGYKRFVSPLLGNNCRFMPTCSSYAYEAIETHGVLKGCLLALWRILRCNPFGKTGIDPVPPKGHWKNTPESLAAGKEKYAAAYLRQCGLLPRDEDDS